jgi:hypothetical protein
MFIQTNLFVLSLRAFGLKPPGAGNTAQSYDYMKTTVSVSLPIALLVSVASLAAFLFVRALNERLRPSSPALSSIAALYGYVGLAIFQLDLMGFFYIEQRIASGTARKTVEELLPSLFMIDAAAGFASAIFLGAWIFLVSWIAREHGGLPGLLNYFGFVTAVALVIADLTQAGGVPGRGMLLGSIWLVLAGTAVWLRPRLRTGG